MLIRRAINCCELILAGWLVHVSDFPSSLLRAWIRSPVSIIAVIHALFLSLRLMLRRIHSCVAHFHTLYSFMRRTQTHRSCVTASHSFIDHVLHTFIAHASHSFILHVSHSHFLFMRRTHTHLSCVAASHSFVDHVSHTLIIHALHSNSSFMRHIHSPFMRRTYSPFVYQPRMLQLGVSLIFSSLRHVSSFRPSSQSALLRSGRVRKQMYIRPTASSHRCSLV